MKFAHKIEFHSFYCIAFGLNLSLSLSFPFYSIRGSVCVRFPFCSHISYPNVEIHYQYAHCAHTQSVANQKKNILSGMKVAHIDKIKEVEFAVQVRIAHEA